MQICGNLIMMASINSIGTDLQSCIINRMRNLQKKTSIYYDQIDIESEEDKQVTAAHHDYISLRFHTVKEKANDTNQELLNYFTAEKYNQYLNLLKQRNKSSHPINHSKDDIKQLNQMARIGKNICLRGAGSKINYLRKMAQKYLTDYEVFEIKGFLPTVNEKKIYNHFGNFLLALKIVNRIDVISMKDQLELYKDVLSRYNNRIVVLFHSIDSPNFLNPESQQKLSDLFDIPNLQLVCSIDNFKIVLSWSPITLQKFKFLFFHIDTHQPYLEEQKHRPLHHEKKQNSQEALDYVWQSLNKNQKQILKFIAQNQLNNIGKQQSQQSHYSFHELLQICIEEIVLSSDNQLRQNLLQLLDHKVILERTDDKRNKRIYDIKYQKRLLEKIAQLPLD